MTLEQQDPAPLTAAETADLDLFHAQMQELTLREKWTWPHVAKLAGAWVKRYSASRRQDAAK